MLTRRRQWHSTPVLLPGKSHGRRSLAGCRPWGLEESDTTERLHFHFSLSCIGEGNGNPPQYSCLENSMDRGAGWATVCGAIKNWTRLSEHSCCCQVASVVSVSVWPHRRQPTRLPHPWDSPGKNTGVGCHFLLQCMKVKSESEVAQLCLTLCDPMDCSLPGYSIHGISRQEYWSGVPLPSPKTSLDPRVKEREAMSNNGLNVGNASIFSPAWAIGSLFWIPVWATKMLT